MKWLYLFLQVLCVVMMIIDFKRETFAILNFVCSVGYCCSSEIADLKRKLNLR